jgi:hypothetical protein
LIVDFSSVANGFLGVKGVQVVILYPSGKVSNIQERQLTTLGQNITALEVEKNMHRGYVSKFYLTSRKFLFFVPPKRRECVKLDA